MVILDEIESHCVGPFEDLSAFRKDVYSLLQKLYFDPAQVRLILNILHSSLYPDICFFLEFGRLLMVGIAVVIMEIALERETRTGLVIFASFFLLIEAIAVVPACTMG